ncbi:Asp-tRNA(Asn)/Glu-tRNA(Gln) amidotransferase subunit GatA [Candidatus Peribacteria bacterium]|nr:Asp-tRNA(Asn)/Glu-tRNA(Gln) amidotransferase subunit GatA [Candidatus Peribacteria bacterium]MBT4474346.1 Asp-tRNA(Asn)/Glu-tRNA(Gln) amidotransferase subunit GatA [Candidatus Peribacteria bacterium]
MMLNNLTITEAHKKLKSKEISCVELVQSCLDQIDKVDGDINAVVYKNGEKALEEAAKIDAAGKFDHPLTGIPYLAKDVYCEKGIPTTACSNMLRGEKDGKTYMPPYDSTTTKRLKAVGAISIGKTNTDEFTMGASTETSCYGVTKNPHDTSRVAGGSSGGSAAAVAADECIFAIGTDTGGSIRHPAGFCGCYGMRVTYGRTSRYGVMSMASSLDTIGPLCKSVEDTAIVLNTIAGKDPFDATTSDKSVPDYTAALKGDVKGLKIGLPKEYFIEGLDSEVEKRIREAAQVFEDMGAEIVDISLPHTKYAVATYYVLCPCEVSSNMARYDGIRFGNSVKKSESLVDYYENVRSEGFGDEVKRRIMIGTYALSAGYYDAYYRKSQKVRTLVKKDFSDAFEKVDLIISPTTPTPAFKVGGHADDLVAMYLEDVFLVSQVLAGIPAMSVPTYSSPRPSSPRRTSGEATSELPIGLQIMGPQFGEEKILNAAHAFCSK